MTVSMYSNGNVWQCVCNSVSLSLEQNQWESLSKISNVRLNVHNCQCLSLLMCQCFKFKIGQRSIKSQLRRATSIMHCLEGTQQWATLPSAWDCGWSTLYLWLSVWLCGLLVSACMDLRATSVGFMCENYFSQMKHITSDQLFPWQLTNPNYPSGSLLSDISHKQDNFCNLCKLREILSPAVPFRIKEINPTHYPVVYTASHFFVSLILKYR